MAKKKTNKKKPTTKGSKIPNEHKQIEELQNQRTGGRIALTGFSFQLIYSCYQILLNDDDDTVFILEGIEDIDKIEINKNTHIQLKHSKNKEDASYMHDILKNFLEVYLIDKSSTFKLAYDFEVANGNLSKLINGTLDKKSKDFWEGKIKNIKYTYKENGEDKEKKWDKENFEFEHFINQISFEKIQHEEMCININTLLIEQYSISTGNEELYANALKILCLEKMKVGGKVKRSDLINAITRVNNDIKKGFINPANNWIKKVNFEYDNNYSPESYYEGKKASAQDIANEIPVRREKLESDIKKLVELNNVTVIKASSGQGKSTLLYRVAYDLKDEYSIYQLNWCNESKEVDNIVTYFKDRVECGEKPIILIDNLGIAHKEWNYFAQRLQEEVKYHYKIIITTREDDWYYYSGDLSNVYKLNIININLSENEAERIFLTLKEFNRLDNTVKEWRKYWNRVSDKKLLIEYIFLITHGEMLSDRISQQIKNINATQYGAVKCELLRKICFADICDVSISIKKLIKNLSVGQYDIGEVLKSIENEFFIKLDQDQTHIVGLHPVRSKHIVDQLHEYYPIDDTAFEIIKLTEKDEFEKLFFYLETFVTEEKESLYEKTVKYLVENKDLCRVFLAIKGVYGRNVKDYYNENKELFDKADEIGGLFLLVTDTSPFSQFKQFGYEFSSIDEISKTVDISALVEIKDNIKKMNLPELSIYYLCKQIFIELSRCDKEILINGLDYFVKITYWLYNIDDDFKLINNDLLIEGWDKRDFYSLETITNLLHISFASDNQNYKQFIENRLPEILHYIKVKSYSTELFVDEKNNLIYVKYMYIRSESKNPNTESVNRLEAICKALPIYETYGADAIKPNIEVLNYFEIFDDSHKRIPIENLNKSFNSEMNNIHRKAIMSNYDCETVYEWLHHWVSIRKEILKLCKNTIKIMSTILSNKKYSDYLANEIDMSRKIINKGLIKSVGYPKEHSEFTEKYDVPEEFDKIRSKYFQAIGNFAILYARIIEKDAENLILVFPNLLEANSNLMEMQMFFSEIINEHKIFEIDNIKICEEENKFLPELISTFKYYMDHEPSQYFNPIDINRYYQNETKILLDEAKNIICDSDEFSNSVTPDKCYFEDISRYYPLIVSNEFDIDDEADMEKILEMIIPFKDLEVEYVVISNKMGDNLINNLGIRISKELLIQASEEYVEEIDILSYTKQIEIGQKFLDCFTDNFILKIEEPKNIYNETCIGILEQLWAYSRYKQELIEEKDIEYLNNISNDIKTKINVYLNELKNNNFSEMYDEMNELCENVYNGLEFDDDLINIEINKLILNQ